MEEGKLDIDNGCHYDYGGCASYTNIEVPEYSDWECYVFSKKADGIVWNPVKDNVPNFFVRFMMTICFGCKWVKKIET